MTANEAADRLRAWFTDYCPTLIVAGPDENFAPMAPSVLLTAALAAERRATVERIDWQAVRSAISNAYYETREAGGTMEAAADRAVAHVRAILDEEAAR